MSTLPVLGSGVTFFLWTDVALQKSVAMLFEHCLSAVFCGAMLYSKTLAQDYQECFVESGALPLRRMSHERHRVWNRIAKDMHRASKGSNR
jgi:hypothetical protein